MLYGNASNHLLVGVFGLLVQYDSELVLAQTSIEGGAVLGIGTGAVGVYEVEAASRGGLDDIVVRRSKNGVNAALGYDDASALKAFAKGFYSVNNGRHG